MVDRALTDFAEAAAGGNREMQWSLSVDVLRRQMEPLFERPAHGDLAAEQALDVAMDFVVARVSNTTEVLSSLFQVLERRIHESLQNVEFQTLTPLEEFFMGLNSEADWATDQNITRKELYPLFVRVAVGKMDPAEGLQTFCDAISAKKDYYLELIRVLVVHLAEEIQGMDHKVDPSPQPTVDSEERSVPDDE
jgi:hypothetical protein